MKVKDAKWKYGCLQELCWNFLTWNGYDGKDKHVGVGRYGVLVGHGRHDGRGAQCGHARHYEHVWHRRHDRHGGYDGYDRHGHQFKVRVWTQEDRIMKSVFF